MNSSTEKLLSWEIPQLGNTILLNIASRYSSQIQGIRPTLFVGKLVTNVIINDIGVLVQHPDKPKEVITLHSLINLLIQMVKNLAKLSADVNEQYFSYISVAVLFYIGRECCSFCNIVRQNPKTSPVYQCQHNAVLMQKIKLVCRGQLG